MKKILLQVVISALTLSAYAQKASIGIMAGGALAGNTRVDLYFPYVSVAKPVTNPASYRYAGYETSKYSRIPSYFGGFVFNVPLGKTFSFRPQIDYVLKGYQQHYSRHDSVDVTTNDNTYKVTANAIEVPLNFVYNASTRKGKMYIGAGPYASYVLSGKRVNTKAITGTVDADQKMVFSDSLSTALSVNRIDYGINFVAGYQWQGGFFINFNYEIGLRNFRILTGNDFPVNKNTHIGLSIGYMFSKKR